MNKIPVVSVLITSYNREKYIAEAIESVLASSLKDFELIIVDDASTDNTYSICTEYAEKDKRIKLYRNPINLKQFGNRNRAASLATTDLIKYLDSDDIIYPHGLEVMVNAMLQYPQAGFAAECYFEGFDKRLPYLFDSNESYINHFIEKSMLLYIGPSGTIFRKSIFTQTGMFNEEIGILADTLLSLQMAAMAPVIGLSRNLFYWRVHNERVTVGQDDELEMMRERHAINMIALNDIKCPLSPENKAIVLRNMTYIYVRKTFRYFLRTFDIF